MKLCMTLLVRDEEDILEAHIRFHQRQGVDLFLVTDNLSEDRSTDILRRFEREGLVRLLREPDDTYAQARWVTRMARLAATEHQADWVINSDADEFWWPAAGDLKKVLASVPDEVGTISVDRFNFVPRPPSLGSIFERMVVREVESTNSLGQPLPPKVCHRGLPDIEVSQGNHSVAAPRLGSGAPSASLAILHFPMRSYPQFENKIKKGGRAYQRNRELPSEIGATWRDLYSLYRQGGLADYYAQEELSDQQIERGLQRTRLVLDRRLQHFFRACQPRMADCS